MSEQTALDLHTPDVATIELTRDFDGRWAARWPGHLVVAGRSPGVGRHDTRTALIAAIEARGWRLRHLRGDLWTAQEVNAHG